MKILATPGNICICGHKKIFHAWLNKEEDQPSLVRFQECGKTDCSCEMYIERTNPDKITL